MQHLLLQVTSGRGCYMSFVLSQCRGYIHQFPWRTALHILACLKSGMITQWKPTHESRTFMGVLLFLCKQSRGSYIAVKSYVILKGLFLSYLPWSPETRLLDEELSELPAPRASASHNGFKVVSFGTFVSWLLNSHNQNSEQNWWEWKALTRRESIRDRLD